MKTNLKNTLSTLIEDVKSHQQQTVVDIQWIVGKAASKLLSSVPDSSIKEIDSEAYAMLPSITIDLNNDSHIEINKDSMGFYTKNVLEDEISTTDYINEGKDFEKARDLISTFCK